jgi:diacylglycerol kinase (ATP)
VTCLTHLAQIRTGFADPIPLAQGKHIQIQTKRELPMQIDGEPWLQKPCTIDLALSEK